MTAFPAGAFVDRGARHVGRLRLRTPDRVQQPRMQMQVEESLRLTSLPGEDQGRLYCIRRLRLPPFDSRSGPTEWSERCSRRLIEAAQSAAHATDPGSTHADVVFFDDVQQPFRLLIARLLNGEAAREWFWPRATGVGVELGAQNRLEQALDRWRAQPGGWGSVARTLLPSIDARAARAFVAAISPGAARKWLTAFASQGEAPTPVGLDPPLRIPSRRVLDDVRGHFGSGDPRVLFFAVLAVLEASPAMMPDIETLRSVVDRADDRPHVNSAAVFGNSSDQCEREAARVTPDLATTAANSSDQRMGHAGGDRRAFGVHPVEALGESASNEPTDHAGFYFLLNVLPHLGIEAALSAHPELIVTHFASRVLLRAAMTCGIGVDDPILQPLLDLPGEHLADPIVVPDALAGLQRLHPSADLNERLWVCAVRRWCRRVARVRARDIVKRTGHIRQTPVSLDITMPMSAVDLDVRRAGLDINPGYVPWFGRVVHFHYVEGEPYERRSSKH